MENHIYRDHERVISVLTNNYGFRYGGIGDNGEECFYRDAEISERVYVHPMFCSHNATIPQHLVFLKIPQRVSFDSDRASESEQKVAFGNLIAHISSIDAKLPPKPTEAATFEALVRQLFLLESKKDEFRAMVTDRNFKHGNIIPNVHRNVTEYARLLESVVFSLKSLQKF